MQFDNNQIVNLRGYVREIETERERERERDTHTGREITRKCTGTCVRVYFVCMYVYVFG